jgi:hypothetical protein
MASVQGTSLPVAQSSLTSGSMDSSGASKQQHRHKTDQEIQEIPPPIPTRLLTSRRLHDSNTKGLLTDSITSAKSVPSVSPSKRIPNHNRNSLPPPRQKVESSRNMSHRNNRFRTRWFLHRSTNPQTSPRSESRHVRIAPCPVRPSSVWRCPRSS